MKSSCFTGRVPVLKKKKQAHHEVYNHENTSCATVASVK